MASAQPQHCDSTATHNAQTANGKRQTADRGPQTANGNFVRNPKPTTASSKRTNERTYKRRKEGTNERTNDDGFSFVRSFVRSFVHFVHFVRFEATKLTLAALFNLTMPTQSFHSPRLHTHILPFTLTDFLYFKVSVHSHAL